ncbi:SDR family oxidoreductase [Streptomyces sp. NPDC052012]|uniref:SDR family oxidoreductase n=1 Tax=Streptomyces sp. NPDC052012 TaxID=3155051 RepID=UPI00344DFD93
MPALPCDTHDPAGPDGVIDAVVDRLGRLDHLVNLIAAPPRPGRLTELDPLALRGALDRHLVMPLAWTRSACRRRLAEHGGSVVNVVTDAVRDASQAAATAALTELTEWLSAELEPRVAVRTVVPSPSTSAAAYRTALTDAVPRLLARPGGEAAHRVHGPVLVLTAPPERPSHAA